MIQSNLSKRKGSCLNNEEAQSFRSFQSAPGSQFCASGEEGRKERHRAAPAAACSETGPPKPATGARPGSGTGSQACPKPALTPGEPKPKMPNPGPGASSSSCWPQSPRGWCYPAPGSDAGRNRNPSRPTGEVWARQISHKPKHLALCVQWRTEVVERFFCQQKTVRIAHPVQTWGVRKKGGGNSALCGRQPKFLTLLRQPPVSIPISSCLVKTRSMQQAPAASPSTPFPKPAPSTRHRSLAVRVTGVIHAPHVFQVARFSSAKR